MYSKEVKEYAIECMKKGYKYLTFYGTCAVLWKNKPKYERVHTVHTVSFGSSDGGYTFGPCMWVDTDSKGEDYFGTPDPGASILLSTLDSDWQRLFIKSLFEIAADGLTETLVKHIVDELILNNIFEVKAVYGRICDIKHSDDSGQNRTYMLYANVTTDSEENGIVYCPKYSDVNVSYLRMMCHNGDANFDITELVNYELSNSTNFTDKELAWILDYAINGKTFYMNKEVTMDTKDEKKLAIEYLKKGYKYVTFDDCHVALWKIRPTYKRVHIGSNDDSCMASVCLWVNTDGKTDDYFGVAESDAAMFFSEHKDPTVMIKSLFEIASDGLSERMIDCIFDHMNVADMIDIKSVQGHISSFNVHDSYDVHAYMMYITIVTNRGAKPLRMIVTKNDPLYYDFRNAYYHIATAENCFDITDIVKETLESKRISKNLYLKYFTDDEIECILEYLDNYDDICGIWVEKMPTPTPYLDALAITAFHSSSYVETKHITGLCLLCMFETLDYYTKYYITESEIKEVIAKGIWYTKHAKD